ncbi:MAG: RuBisCO large subunit C-terminal-like domain-containing protein, partial [Tuberibacillus sp.]
LHTNGLNNKFYESNDSVIRSVQDCLTPMFRNDTVMPVLSSGQWAGTAIESYKSMKTVDLIHLAGGGIMAHPGGTAAGVESMKQGWEAALAGVTLEDYATSHLELAQSVEKFGR